MELTSMALGQNRRTRTRPAGALQPWVVPALVVFSALPLTFGILRILQLAGLSDVMPAAPAASTIPLVTHIVGAILYALLGAIQFAPRIRSRWPGWHRASGRLLVVAGILVAISALWLSVAHSTTTFAGVILLSSRLLFASTMLTSIVLGLAAILRRDVTRHRAWMMRAYAIALGASTQMLAMMLVEIVAGPPDELGRSIVLTAAWVINLAIAEWRIRRARR